MRKLKKKILGGAIKALPRSLRYSIYRKMISVPSALPNDVTVKVAETLEEIEGALHLLNVCYKEQGFVDPNSQLFEINKFQLLPTSTILIAKKGERVIGTMTLVRRSKMGLPMETVFNLKRDLQQTDQCCEITCLAIDKKHRRQNGENILFPLMKYMYHYCRDYFRVDQLFIVCYPQDAHFYRALFVFEDIQGPSFVDDYKGAPAQALKLDLHKAYRELKAIYSESHESHDLFSFFTEKQYSQLVFPNREYHKISDSHFNLEILQYLISKRSYKFSKLNELEVLYFKGLFDEEKKDGLFKTNLRYFEKRQEKRFDANHTAVFSKEEPAALPSQENSQTPRSLRILDVSLTGIRVVSEEKFSENETYRVRVEIGTGVETSLQVKLAWTRDGESAFRIIRCDGLWEKYLTYLKEQSAVESRKAA